MLLDSPLAAYSTALEIGVHHERLHPIPVFSLQRLALDFSAEKR